MKKNLKAFTLVEMLVVMGIIVILMAVGIASARYALRRANKIEHQNAAEQIYQALQSYYADNREYPADAEPSVLVGTTLAEYIDDFDGGSEATYYYDADTTQQSALICVSLGGASDVDQLGFYCTGNAVGATGLNGIETITVQDVEYTATPSADYTALSGWDAALASDWSSEGAWE